MAAEVVFPVDVQAVFTGKAKSSGSFTDAETGELVSFSEAYGFDFEDAEGNIQRLTLRGSKIVQVGDVDPAKLTRYQDQVHVVGNVHLREGGGNSFFRLTALTKVGRGS